MDLEKRGLNERIEVRQEDDGSVSVSGYAAVFNEETDIGGMFREVILPGAFKNALSRGDDVAFLINHDGLPLARSPATMSLREDDKGLYVQSRLDGKDPDVQRIIPKMQRGDLSKMSFAFSMQGGRQQWRKYNDEDEERREIVEVGALYDVSVVTFPAYEGTSIALRHKNNYYKEFARDTNFPNQGDDQKISLRNSEYPQFDFDFAEDLKENHPDIWGLGGNIRGNQAFNLWKKARSGEETEGVLDWIKEREAWAARHFGDGSQFKGESLEPNKGNVAGIVSQVKWGVIGTLGESRMKSILRELIRKLDERQGARVAYSLRKARQENKIRNIKDDPS